MCRKLMACKKESSFKRLYMYLKVFFRIDFGCFSEGKVRFVFQLHPSLFLYMNFGLNYAQFV